MTVKIKNRHRLKTKEIKKIQNEFWITFNQSFFDEKSTVETGEVEGIKILLVDDIPCFFEYENKLVFTLQGLYRFKPIGKYVIVDMGAVGFVTNGADVMAPGIVDADEDINENDPVWICDEKHHKPLAVGFATMNGEEMITDKKGKAVRVIHYVGDRLWDLTAKSL